MTRRAGELSRRDVAELLDLHPDSVSRLLHDGLGYAVTEWGGRGAAMRFDRRLVDRWHSARDCHQGHGGGPCNACALVLEDAQAVSEHLIAERHGHGQCPECTAPPRLASPCSYFGG